MATRQIKETDTEQSHGVKSARPHPSLRYTDPSPDTPPMPSRTFTLPFLMAFIGAFTMACTKTRTARLELPPLTAVSDLDLNRYAGTWYEIASYPQRFQEGCTGTTATYSLNEDGTIGVLNRCRKDSLDGPEVNAEGTARMKDPGKPAELEVSFFGPFWGDYWVIDLDDDYRFAVIGQPSRDYLWILSRTPTMAESVYRGILERLTAKHYPLEPLKRTLHAETEAPSVRPTDSVPRTNPSD